jgi:hypothetical protein
VSGALDCARVAASSRIASIFVAALLFACTSFLEVDSLEMAPRLEYEGFSFERPPYRWYLHRDESNLTGVTLRRRLVSPEHTHTFFARVSLGRLTVQPTSHEDFATFAAFKLGHMTKAPYFTEETSRRTELATRQDQWCIRFETTSRARGAPPAPSAELIMTMRGYRCLHPALSRTTLDFYYSERGLAEELDPALSEEGEAFLDGVRIDADPDLPDW